MCDFCGALNGGRTGKVELALPPDLEPILNDDKQWVVPLGQVAHAVGTEVRRIAADLIEIAKTSPLGGEILPLGLAVTLLCEALKGWAHQFDPKDGG